MSQPQRLFWIALSLVFLLLGLTLGNVLLLTGAVFVLLFALLMTALTPPSGIAVERNLPRETCWVGDTLTMSRWVTAHRGIGPVFVYDALPPETEVVDGSNLRVVWKWPGKRTADTSYRLQFPKRGQFALARSVWEAKAPYGVRGEESGSDGHAFEVSVVPRIRRVTRLNAVRAIRKRTRYQDDPTKTGASTNEFKELRPYQPGDPFKWINWKATSRAARADNLPLVNELESETRRAAWIFLDIASYMDVGVPLSNPLESTVEASGTLAQYYLSRGSTLGAFAYNSSGGTGELLTPESGMRQFSRLMQMMAGLKPGPPEQDLLQSVERCKSFLYRTRPDVFVITRLDVQYARPGEDPAPLERFKTAISRLTALRMRSRRYSTVRVVHVEPQDPRTASQGLGLGKWEARLVARDVRQKGAAVIEWAPTQEEFTSVLMRHVDAYK